MFFLVTNCWNKHRCFYLRVPATYPGELLAFVWDKLCLSPDRYSAGSYNLSLWWNMHSKHLWYHSDNIDPLICAFSSLTCALIIHNPFFPLSLFPSRCPSLSLSLCWQPTCRKNWLTSSPSYWTAPLRSKASTTLPRYLATPPWSCAKDSAASWLPFAGFQAKADELGGVVTWLLPLPQAQRWAQSMDLF